MSADAQFDTCGRLRAAHLPDSTGSVEFGGEKAELGGGERTGAVAEGRRIQ